MKNTQLAVVEQQQSLVRQHSEPSFPDLVSMGDQLVRTGFLPAHIKTGPQFAAIVMQGRELGMKPMRALRSLSMIKGKVVEYADSQLSRFKADGGRAEFVTLTEERAELRLVHPNGDNHTEVFTMQDAKRADLLTNSNYAKSPKAMLRSRVITAALKSLGWEGGVGAYDPDEARAFSDEAQAEPVEEKRKADTALQEEMRQKVAELRVKIGEQLDALGLQGKEQERTKLVLEINGGERPTGVAEYNAVLEELAYRVESLTAPLEGDLVEDDARPATR